MLILDALRRSKSPQEIEFLLTCYLDGLQFYAVAKRLPQQVMVQPVQGLDDIEARLLSLREVLPETGFNDVHHAHAGDHAIVNEVTEVLSVAVSCLAGHVRRDPHNTRTRRGRRATHTA